MPVVSTNSPFMDDYFTNMTSTTAPVVPQSPITNSSSNSVPPAGTGAGSAPAPTVESPSHYRYLKEFRVSQCQLFPLHKCSQHRPFTCFNWHFPNQRRRRPVRKRDGTFNYSPDNYCSKYDETSGTCADGDDCPLLHRTAGDTERRYHLRYFKTCMCVYETDTRGFCTKNGAHCAFAHGENDKRPPVFDVREMQIQNQQQILQQNGGNLLDSGSGSMNSSVVDETMMNLSNQLIIGIGPNQLDKERNMMIDLDPKWQDTRYVLSTYKTDPCKRPPRLCRQGYACPQYHNPRDRRRSPKTYKYRSTPCPNVKHGDEWGEPTLCDDGDQCAYCHTRTEQQFHPEIYKSSKCHDVYTQQYCPRGPFCAFAHSENEIAISRNLNSSNGGGTGANLLADLLITHMKPQKQLDDGDDIGFGDDTSIQELKKDELNCLDGIKQQIENDSNNAQLQQQQSGSSSTAVMLSSSNFNDSANSLPFGSLSFASAVAQQQQRGNNNNNLNNSNPGGSTSLISSSSIVNNFLGSFSNLVDNSGSGFTSALGGLLDNSNTSNNGGVGGYSLFGSARTSSTLPPASDLPLSNIPNGTQNSSSTPSNGFPSSSSIIGSNVIGIGIRSSPINISNTSSSSHHSNIVSNGFGSNSLSSSQSSTNTPTQNQTTNLMFNTNISTSSTPWGSNNNNSSTLSSTMLNYTPLQALQSTVSNLRSQLMEYVNAIESISDVNSVHYIPCLQCNRKDHPRTIILTPCEHQVLCNSCASSSNVLYCPLCGGNINNRKK